MLFDCCTCSGDGLCVCDVACYGQYVNTIGLRPLLGAVLKSLYSSCKQYEVGVLLCLTFCHLLSESGRSTGDGNNFSCVIKHYVSPYSIMLKSKLFQYRQRRTRRISATRSFCLLLQSRHYALKAEGYLQVWDPSSEPGNHRTSRSSGASRLCRSRTGWLRRL